MRTRAMAAGLLAVGLTPGCAERLIPELGLCGDGKFAPGDICFSGDGEVARYKTPDLTPISLRGADFTGDGEVDVLVMGTDASGVVAGRMLVGVGDGTLRTPIDAGVYGCSAHPVPGAVDTAAPVDLLVDECGDSVSLFVGTAQGVFSAPTSVYVGARTRSSGLVDLNGDARSEVVVLGSAPDESPVLSIAFPADGTASPLVLPVGDIGPAPFDPVGFAVSDPLRDDTRIVLVDPTIVGGLAVMEHPLRRTGAARIEIDFTPLGAAVADLDEDGEDEILVTSKQDGALVTLEVDAPGEPPREVGRTPSDITPLARQLTDVDGDQHLDLVMSEAESTALAIFRGRGDGTFDPPVFVDVGMIPEQFFLADLDGDNAPDLIAADFSQAAIVVLLAAP